MRIPTESGDVIALPLNEILSRLPHSLATLVLARPGGTFAIPLSAALEQLRTGAVRVAFAELRQSSPPGTFADNAAHDDALIDLPLPLILTAIGPGALGRRSDQKRTEVPDEVTGVFEARRAQPKLAALASSGRPPAPMAPRPVAPKAAPPPPPAARKQAAPAPPPAAPKPTTGIAASPAAAKPASPLPFATTRPSPPPVAAPAPDVETVVTTIEAVCDNWPDPIRQEIQQRKLRRALISIPLDCLELGMKAGRIVFTWTEVCGWLSDPLPPSPYGESQVELPLPVIAPLFLAKHRRPPPRKVVTVSQDVPDLFGSVGRPAAKAAAAAPALAAAPVAPNILGEIFGQPSKADWTPEEVAERILAMPGVAGALVGANDGLLVAGRLPAPLQAETMAAFLPQIFARVGGCTEEVQLGTLRALRLSAGQAPCAVLKAGSLYLAVLGRPGQTMPEAVLERIAGGLAQANP